MLAWAGLFASGPARDASILRPPTLSSPVKVAASSPEVKWRRTSGRPDLGVPGRKLGYTEYSGSTQSRATAPGDG